MEANAVSAGSGARVEGRPQGAELRVLLVNGFGWTPVEDDVVLVPFRRQTYRLTTLARNQDRIARLWEWPGHAELTDYQLRHELHRRAVALPGDALSIFTDAASTRQVWARTVTTVDGLLAYREVCRDAGAPPPARLLSLADSPISAPEVKSSAYSEGAEAARMALLLRLRRHPMRADWSPALRRGRPCGQQLQDLIARSRTPDVPRRVWHELERLRVLDPACGDPEWLLGCLEALIAVATSCLERMRVWMDAVGRSPGRPRRRQHSDFKLLVSDADVLACDGSPDRLAIETILLLCLRGIEADPAAAVRSRERLTQRIGEETRQLIGYPASDVFADVRVGEIGGGVSSAEELAALIRANPSLVASMGSVAAEAETLCRAEEQLVRMRLREHGSAQELAEGRAVIASRRRQLARTLARQFPAQMSEQVLHPWIEYHSILRSGGFDLIRRYPSMGNSNSAANGQES